MAPQYYCSCLECSHLYSTQQHWIIIASFCKGTSFAVQGLTEGQEYLFRILAANANGTGLPLDGVNPIKAKAPFDVPDAPGAPVVTEVGGDFVNLSWNKPEEDGGSRIKGYWIEKREGGMELWQRVNQFIQAATQINIRYSFVLYLLVKSNQALSRYI